MKIKKFKIHSNANDDEFVILRTTKSITIVQTEERVDSDGNPLSSRDPIKQRRRMEVKENITAKGYGSGDECLVEILESEDGSSESSTAGMNIRQEDAPSRPINMKDFTGTSGGRGQNINLTKAMNPEFQPMSDKVIGGDEILWVD